MKQLLPLFFVLVAAAGCNADRVGAPAPQLAGASWLQTVAEVEPEMEGRWVLVEFFAPT